MSIQRPEKNLLHTRKSMKKKDSILLGAHVSIEGGFYMAVARAREIGATCFQIFTKSNRQWHSKPISAQEAQKFKESLKEASEIKSVVAHASYLINCASEKSDVREKSIKGLADELLRCHQLSIPYLVMHPGSSAEKPREAVLTDLGKTIRSVLKDSQSDTTLLLETMAGQGNTLGATFDEIAAILDAIGTTKRIGICLDTCHLFAAGYEINTPHGYKAAIAELDKKIGLNKIHVIHMNDSKKKLNSHVDRHEHIGQGEIGLVGFELFMNDGHWQSVPKILETPKDDSSSDKKNIETLLGLIKRSKA